MAPITNGRKIPAPTEAENRRTLIATFLRTVLPCFVVALLGTGCITSWTLHPVGEVVPPAISSTMAGDGIPVAITVKDCREFGEAWLDQYDYENLPLAEHRNDPTIRARTISVRHILSEGENVANLVRLALEKAFYAQGYRVCRVGDPKYANAKTVNVSVGRFWIWDIEGVRLAKRSIDIRATFDGDIPELSGGREIRSLLHDRHRRKTEEPQPHNAYVSRGLADFAQQVEKQLPKVSAGAHPTVGADRPPDATAARLEHLKALHEKKLITDEEYKQKRQAILNEL